MIIVISYYGWKIKTWKFSEQEKMNKWISEHEHEYLISSIFINNELAVEYKRLIKAM